MSRAYSRAPSAALPIGGTPLPPRTDRRDDEDRALGDPDIMRLLFISKPTLLRYRREHGLPGPHFRVGQRSFTWRSAVLAWIAEREAAGVHFQPKMNIQRGL